jgi:hypothetical protein
MGQFSMTISAVAGSVLSDNQHMADPKHEEHDQMLEWHGGKFDPDEADIGRILDNFERLAKKWAPKPRKPKAAVKRL